MAAVVEKVAVGRGAGKWGRRTTAGRGTGRFGF
jgi:hypothetical protein